MEIKYVDEAHGYAAFAPTKKDEGPTDESIAFRPGDTVAVEAPIVAWQQMISRWLLKGEPTREEDGSEEAQNADDDEDASGGGIHTCCSLCLNSLLSVEEEMRRIASFTMSSEGNVGATYRKYLCEQLVAFGHFVVGGKKISVEEAAAVGRPSTSGSATTTPAALMIDWSQWFMTAVPKGLLDGNLLPTGEVGVIPTASSRKAKAAAAEWRIVLKPISTQRRIAISRGRTRPTKSQETAQPPPPTWELTFCGDDCLRRFDEQFGVTRWLNVRVPSNTETSTSGTASEDIVVEDGTATVRHLLTQYLLFDRSLNDELMNVAGTTTTPSEGGDEDAGNSTCEKNTTTLAASPLVAGVRAMLWDSLVGGYIHHGGDDDDGDESPNTQEQQEVYHLRAEASMERCLGVINVLASTFNERYKLMILLVCRSLEQQLVARLSKLSACDAYHHNLETQHHPASSPSSSTSATTLIDPTILETLLANLDVHLQDTLCASYEEGPYRPYTWRQRESVRVFTALVNEWLRLLLTLVRLRKEGCGDDDAGTTSEESGDETTDATPRRYISIQTVQMMAMVLDSNVHSCVVLSPWYALIDDANTSPSVVVGVTTDSPSEKHDGSNHNSDASAVTAVDATSTLAVEPPPPPPVSVEHLLFRLAPPTLINNMGVALYNRCTKINHSCRPNVRFVPTFAPARAHVVARGGGKALARSGGGGGCKGTASTLRPHDSGDGSTLCTSCEEGIPFGAELRTSYLDVDEEFSEARDGVVGSVAGVAMVRSTTTTPRDGDDPHLQCSLPLVKGGHSSNYVERRARLKRDYGFDCDCVRCAEEGGNTV